MPPDSGQPRTRATDSDRQQDWVPRPDPTELTTEALERETKSLKDLLEMRIVSIRDVTNEKFAAIDKEFDLIESRRVEQKKDTKDALDAALAAAKEAVSEQTIASEKSIDKSEKSTDKRIEQLGVKVDTEFVGQRRDIDDIRERLIIIESKKEGNQEQISKQSQSLGFVIGAVGLFFTFLSIILLVSDAFTK